MASRNEGMYPDGSQPDEEEAYSEADYATATAEDTERLRAMSQEERDRQRREWLAELEKTEEEIQTLRQVLNSKLRRANDLKRRLGISVLGELRSDIRSSWMHLKESGTFQRTASAAKGAKARTSELTQSMASRVSEKWSSVRNSNAVKSLGGRMGSAYSNVKARMSSSGAGTGAAAGGGGDASFGNSGADQQQREKLRQLAEAGGVDDAEDAEGASAAATAAVAAAASSA